MRRFAPPGLIWAERCFSLQKLAHHVWGMRGHCVDCREMCGQPRHASPLGGGPRSRFGSLATLAAMRRASVAGEQLCRCASAPPQSRRGERLQGWVTAVIRQRQHIREERYVLLGGRGLRQQSIELVGVHAGGRQLSQTAAPCRNRPAEAAGESLPAPPNPLQRYRRTHPEPSLSHPEAHGQRGAPPKAV